MVITMSYNPPPPSIEHSFDGGSINRACHEACYRALASVLCSFRYSGRVMFDQNAPTNNQKVTKMWSKIHGKLQKIIPKGTQKALLGGSGDHLGPKAGPRYKRNSTSEFADPPPGAKLGPPNGTKSQKMWFQGLLGNLQKGLAKKLGI